MATGTSSSTNNNKPFFVTTSTFAPSVERVQNRIRQKEGDQSNLFWLTTPSWLSENRKRNRGQGSEAGGIGVIDGPNEGAASFPGFSANDVRDSVNSVTTRNSMNDNQESDGIGDQKSHSSSPSALSLITILTFATAFVSVLLIVLCLNGNYKVRRQQQPHHHHHQEHLSRSASSSFSLSKVSSFFLPDCMLRAIGSSPSKSVSSTLASHHALHLHHHHPQFHSSSAAISSTYNSAASTPSQSAPAYFCPLDPTHLVPSPPSPLIRSSILSHGHHHHHAVHPVKDLTSSASSNSSAGSTSTSVTVGGGIQPGNNMIKTANSMSLHNAHNNRRSSGFVQDVSPYADPVSVTGHEYEDIGSVMRGESVSMPYSMTLQLNTSAHQQQQQQKSYNVNHRTLNPRTAPTQHHQQQLQQQVLSPHNNCGFRHPHHDRSPDEETLYYDRSNGRNLEPANIAGPDTTVITPSSSVIYGSRNNGLSLGSNYVFHNTR